MAWSRAPFRRIATVVVAISACAGACVAWSAELLVRVQDGDGVALPDVAVSLLRVGAVPAASGETAPGAAPGAPGVPSPAAVPRRATSDLSGRAAFSDLAPGVYRAVLGSGLAERWLLAPPETECLLTLPDERASVEMTLVLRRGDRLVTSVETDEKSSACASITLREQASGEELMFTACSRREASRIVPPGRWSVSVAGQNGAVFQSLVLDGVTAPGASAELEVTAGGRSHFLQLRYATGCTVSGRARWNVGNSPPASVCARLAAPGPMLAAALAAGEKQPDHPCFPLLDSGNWSGRVADGTWTIAPEGERLIASEPPSATFECRANETGSFDFELEVRDEAETDKLFVKVVSADGEPVSGAVVELFPREAGSLDTASPLQSDQGFGRDGVVSFPRAPRRELVAVATHPVFGDGRLELGLRRGHVVLALERRATLAIRAEGPGGKPFRGIEVALDAVDEDKARGAAPAAAAASTWRKHQAHRLATTDATGRAMLQGLRPGPWRVRPSMTGSDAARWSASIVVAENERVPETVLTVPETGQLPLLVRVALATTLELRLTCDDGGKVPMRASVALLEPHADAPWRSALPVGKLEAAKSLDGLPLGGPQLDRLVAGPLPAGTFAIAIRPEGFDRWTFAPGTEDPARAGVLALNEGEALELGTWELNCRPSILLVPEWREPGPDAPPDIARAEVAVELAPEGAGAGAGTARRDATAGPPVAAPARTPYRQPLLNALRLTGLDPGRFTATIAITDRLLLPDPARPEDDGTAVALERGREIVRRVPFSRAPASLDV